MAGFVARKITVFSIFFNQRTIALVTLNNVLECCHFFIHLRYIHIFFYFRIDGQSSVQFSEYAKSANPPIPPIPTALCVLFQKSIANLCKQSSQSNYMLTKIENNSLLLFIIHTNYCITYINIMHAKEIKKCMPKKY